MDLQLYSEAILQTAAADSKDSEAKEMAVGTAADMAADRVAYSTELVAQELQTPAAAAEEAEHLTTPLFRLLQVARVRSGTLYSHDSM